MITMSLSLIPFDFSTSPSKYPFFDYEIYKLRIAMSLFRYAYIISDTLISQIPILNACERRVSISTFNYC